MLHTFVSLVDDKPGVLTRVASLFRRLNVNIVSLTVGESEREGISRMTIVCEAPEHAADRIRASLYKLEITRDVDELGRSEAVIRELCLIKVAAGPNSPHGQHSRSQIFELANVFRARVVDLAPESIMLEMTGAASKIEGLLQVLRESKLRGPRGLAHRPHGHAPRPPHQPRAQSPRHQNRRATQPSPSPTVPTPTICPTSSTKTKLTHSYYTGASYEQDNTRQFIGQSAARFRRAVALALICARKRRLIGSAPTARLRQVQLLDGPMLVQFQHNHALFLNLNEDSLLKPFRQLTGLPAPGEDMGGWYSPSPALRSAEEHDRLRPRPHLRPMALRPLARLRHHRRQSDPAKVHRLVAGFAPTISQRFYEDYCLPAYTFDKTNVRPHRRASVRARSATPSPSSTTPPTPSCRSFPTKALDRTEMAARPHPNISYTWDETYTLPENFYLAYTARRRRPLPQTRPALPAGRHLLHPLALNKNILPGQHAYSHVNALCSAMQAYLVDGSQKHLDRRAETASASSSRRASPPAAGARTKASQKPDTNGLADSLTKTHSSFETPCGAYGHFKITRYLMCATGDSRYGDSMETVLYNTILGARPIRPDGISFYYADYNNEAQKVDYEQKWPCCSGTFPQLTADYGISSYFRSAKGIAVNLYSPRASPGSRAAHASRSPSRPSTPPTATPRMHLTLDRTRALHHRPAHPCMGRPANPSHSSTATRADATLTPGTWLNIDRTWKDGDRIELSLDMPLRLVPIDSQHPDLVALMHGPVALFAIQPATGNAHHADNFSPRTASVHHPPTGWSSTGAQQIT